MEVSNRYKVGADRRILIDPPFRYSIYAGHLESIDMILISDNRAELHCTDEILNRSKLRTLDFRSDIETKKAEQAEIDKIAAKYRAEEEEEQSKIFTTIALLVAISLALGYLLRNAKPGTSTSSSSKSSWPDVKPSEYDPYGPWRRDADPPPQRLPPNY